jgi:hypothetical protein
MKRPSPSIVYVGSADCAAHAVFCLSCYAAIGTPCVPNRHTGAVPHQARRELAEAIGLRDAAPAPLLGSAI